MDIDHGIIEGMTILTTTIDRAVYLAAANGHFSIINPCQLIMDRARSAYVTTRRAEDHTILLAICTNSTTCDRDLSLTTSCVSFTTGRHACGCVIIEVSH